MSERFNGTESGGFPRRIDSKENPHAAGEKRGGQHSTCADYEEEHIIDNVKETGAYLEEKLDGLVSRFDFIKERRGMGLMQGLVFDRPVGPVITKALDKGLILINAGTDIIRFVPPLIITKEHVDEMTAILTNCLE